jgi:TatD DNase family protein
LDRILLETDAPDALPKLDNVSVSPVPVHSSDADTEKHHKDSESQAATASNESLNHPENIHIVSVFFLDALDFFLFMCL